MLSAIQNVVDDYLTQVDAELPGLVEGLYLVGSVALGDFKPRTSDIDFIAVTAQPPDSLAVNGLRRIHHRLRVRQPRPHFDGSYVTWSDLSRDPEGVVPAARAHEGRLHRARPGRVETPVTWHTLARHGVPCRGLVPAKLDVFLDRARLTAWTLRNLDEYWQQYWLRRAHRRLSLHRLFALTPSAALWLVTGVSRMHCTALTGDIISKEAAAHYALATFPERWHRLINDCLRVRRNDSSGAGIVGNIIAGLTEYLPRAVNARPLYRTPLQRRSDALEFAEMVIADASRM
jgi:Domain of unknown function (DUF4111)/Nucleotidyltransferase domain